MNEEPIILEDEDKRRLALFEAEIRAVCDRLAAEWPSLHIDTFRYHVPAAALWRTVTIDSNNS
jgi:hypothetical protein